MIEGKYKGKRRDGLDGVLSSDEEDDEDKRMAKRKWRKEQERRARELGKGLAELGESPNLDLYTRRMLTSSLSSTRGNPSLCASVPGRTRKRRQ